jgi:hypothetical protein
MFYGGQDYERALKSGMGGDTLHEPMPAFGEWAGE